MFCAACRALLEQIQVQPIGEEDIQYHAPSVELDAAIDSNCSLCRRMGWRTGDHRNGSWSIFTSPYDWPESESLGIKIPGTISLSLCKPGEIEVFKLFKLVPVTTKTDRLRFPGYTSSNTIGDERSMALARHWLKICTQHHQACGRPQAQGSAGWRPTRLLDVGIESSAIRLVQGKDIAYDNQYVTLSHCWGKVDDKLVLTKSNLKEWTKQLPPIDRWKTFTDAIKVARSLGYSYIWIDSLCIIQDSVEDWRAECPQMCNIYKHSACNIAATTAEDDTAGFIVERDTDMDLPLRAYFKSKVGPDTTLAHSSSVTISASEVSKTSLEGPYDLCDEQTWLSDITFAVLNTRGWVIQERLISPRVLNFTGTQMYWECCELQASESYPHGFPFEPYADVTYKRWSPFFLESLLRDGEDEEAVVKTAFEVWGRAVTAFTVGGPKPGGFARNLTKSSDKLVAISAVARALQPYLKCRYWAGHWEKDFIRQLTWTGLNGSERVDSYRAPSWSWASVDAPIQTFDKLYKRPSLELSGLRHGENRGDSWQSLVAVLDVQTELESEDPMGQVKNGILRLHGKLIAIEVKSMLRSRFGGGPKIKEEEIIMVNNWRTMLHIQRDDERYPWRLPYQLYCIPICINVDGEDEDAKINFHAILVETVGGTSTFRRVGYLGQNLVQRLTPYNFLYDPLLRRVGSFKDGLPSIVGFTPNLDDQREIVII